MKKEGHAMLPIEDKVERQLENSTHFDCPNTSLNLTDAIS